MLFVTILVDFTLARVHLDIQEMAKIALVCYICLTSAIKFIDCKEKNCKIKPHKIKLFAYCIAREFFSCFSSSWIFSAIRKQNFPHNTPLAKLDKQVDAVKR